MHVHVHSADGDPLPSGGRSARRVWNLTARPVGIIRRADGRRVRVENSVTQVRLEIEQSIKWRIPGAVRPDVIKDTIVVDAVAAANRHLSIPEGIPGKTEAGAKVMVLRFPHPADRNDARVGDTGRVKDIAVQVGELGQDAVIFARCTKTLPAKSEVQCQTRGNFPVVLNEGSVVMISIVAISIRPGSRSRINGRLLTVGV